MKICLTAFSLDNWGGIVSNTNNLIWGLQELGHEVDYFLLGWQDKFARSKRTSEQLLKRSDWRMGPLQMPCHTMFGWNFAFDKKIPYKGRRNLAKAKNLLKKYDLVIWTIPVPTRKKANKGNYDWVELYKANANNIVYSHDAHMQDRYPHLYEVKPYLSGIASTNYASYNTIDIGGVQKALIFSSHDVRKHKQKLNYDYRSNGFLSLQVFKSWKRVDDLVRAIPYMESMKKLVAGGGLEQAYMTSKDKCKDEYFCNRQFDPNLLQKFEGTRIWNRAIDNEMKYLGWITPEKRDSVLQKIKCLIDPSWSLSFAKHGDHFNRVATDACLNGNILIARNYGITSNAEGNGLIFKANRNYIMIPHNATPKEFAEIVNETQHLPREKWRPILRNNYKLAAKFDRVKSAQSFIDLSQGKPCGFFNSKPIVVPPTTPTKVITNSAKIMKEFFGAKKTYRNEEGITKLF